MRRRRRNRPIAAGIRGMTRVGDWLPLAITGGLSAAGTAAVPAMFGIVNPWARYGTQLGTAFLGGMMVGQFAGRQHGMVWTIVGMSLVGYELLRTYVLQPFFPQLPLGYADYQFDDSQQAQMTAYPDEMHAFPEEVGAYPFNGGYPY